MGKVFTKRLNKDDQGEELLKRLKYIENTQKNIINHDNNESIYYIPRLQFDSELDKDEDKKTTKQQHRHKATKCLWLFKKFKSRGRRFDGWNNAGRCRQGYQHI